jgi:hypothetical protein
MNSKGNGSMMMIDEEDSYRYDSTLQRVVNPMTREFEHQVRPCLVELNEKKISFYSELTRISIGTPSTSSSRLFILQTHVDGRVLSRGQ